LFLACLTMVVPVASAQNQTQYVAATPGFINLGMTTTIQVTGPAAATYTVAVEQPNGTRSNVDLTFASAGQVLNATYGNSTVGFKALVDQAGIYNVFLEQGTQLISSSSFYATNKLLISFQMVTGGTCDYVSGVSRGSKMFPHIFITYASNGAPFTDAAPGASVAVLAPSGQVQAATWDPFAKAYEVGVLPNWNYTFVGPWSPVINASDAVGNIGSLRYTGSPFVISPVQLSTAIVVVNATSGKGVTTLVEGQTVTIMANITYPTNPEPVAGFVGPLSPARGGSVSAEVGWGFYNVTSGTFGGSLAGSLIGVVPMTYAEADGTWSGQFVSTSLPKLPAGATYLVVVSSKDAASPANAGLGTETLSPAYSSVTSVPTTFTMTVSQVVQTIPDAVYAALAILLILGVLIGYIVRVPR
jgi:hypothetical protein